jgi:hypothetical protein
VVSDGSRHAQRLLLILQKPPAHHQEIGGVGDDPRAIRIAGTDCREHSQGVPEDRCGVREGDRFSLTDRHERLTRCREREFDGVLDPVEVEQADRDQPLGCQDVGGVDQRADGSGTGPAGSRADTAPPRQA